MSKGLIMTKLTLLALLTASTLTTASADGMFSMGEMMTDAVKKIKTEITDTVTDIKDSVTDATTDLKNSLTDKEETISKENNATSELKKEMESIKDAPVTVSEDISKK